MTPINWHSSKWRFFFISLCIISSGLGTSCEQEAEMLEPTSRQSWPEEETADKIFLWDKGDNGLNFWNKAINCGKRSQPGGPGKTKGSRVRFGVSKEQRFPGTYSVEMWTNSNYEERCNQNFSAERAEISSYASYRNLGVKEGQTVWLGWSEKWTEIDESHTSTVLQFRSNCGSGSPAVEMYMRPNRRLTLRTRQRAKFVREFMQVKEQVWYDFAVEIKYSKGNDGYIKLWVHEAGKPGSFEYQAPVAEILDNPTMLSKDNCPHIRWGVYRWQSGDKKPNQIKANDRMMVKYIGPARIKLGNNLKEKGLESVMPRPPANGPELSLFNWSWDWDLSYLLDTLFSRPAKKEKEQDEQDFPLELSSVLMEEERELAQ